MRACEARSGRIASEAVSTMQMLIRNETAMKQRRYDMINAYERWGYQKRVAARLAALG